MRKRSPIILATAIVAAATFLCIIAVATAFAGEPLHGRAWDYNVRGSSAGMNRAAMIWQAERADQAQAGTAAALPAAGIGAGASGTGGFGSTANYSIITVVLDDGASGQVNVNTEQDSVGDQTAQAVSIEQQTGDTFSTASP